MENRIIINIGRQFGSGGKSVAIATGGKLGITVYDNELLAKAAEQSGFSAEFFRKSDERHSILGIGSLFGSNRYGQFTNNALSDGELFRIQSETIREIATKGDAIFIGRAANYVLRDMKCLNVFISAPMEDRKRRICERLGKSPEDAESLILKNDKERERFYNFFTFGRWGVASTYHLCLDSSILGIEGTADYIIDFARKAGMLK